MPVSGLRAKIVIVHFWSIALAIRTSALHRVPGRGIGRAVVEQVGFRILGEPAPGRAAADLPLVAVPGLERRILADRLAERHGLLRVEQDFVVRTGRIGAPHLLAGR